MNHTNEDDGSDGNTQRETKIQIQSNGFETINQNIDTDDDGRSQLNALNLLKWKPNAQPKKKNSNTLTITQLEEQKQRRQAFLALYPHRHIPTRAEIDARKRKKKESTYVSPWDSRIQKLFDPVTWFNRQLDNNVLDAGTEFAKQFTPEVGSAHWKWKSWINSGRTDLMPLGGTKFYNGLYVLTRDDFHFQALDSQGMLRTCGIVEKEEEAEFNDKVTCHSEKSDGEYAAASLRNLNTNKCSSGISFQEAGIGNCETLGTFGFAENPISDEARLEEKMQQEPSQKKRRPKSCIFDSDDSIGSIDNSVQSKNQTLAAKSRQGRNVNLCFFDSDESTNSSQD